MDCGIHYSSFFNEEFFKTDKSSTTSRKRNFREALAYMAVFESKQHKDLLPMTLTATIQRAMSWNQQCFRREKQQALT
jgi:hypothetical protein